MARYAGQLIAPAEGFCQGKGFFWPFNLKQECIQQGCHLEQNFHMSNSQILVTWNFSTNQDTVPWIGEKLCIRAEFQQFSRNNMHIRVPGKLSEIYSKVLVFSNPRDNIRFFGKLRDRLVPLFSHISGHCLLDWRTLGLWNVFLTVFQAPWHTCEPWKTLGTPLQCVVLLQSRGQCHD